MFPFSTAVTDKCGKWQWKSALVTDNCRIFVNNNVVYPLPCSTTSTSNKENEIVCPQRAVSLLSKDDLDLIEQATGNINSQHKSLLRRLNNLALTMERRTHEYLCRPEYHIHFRFDQFISMDIHRTINHWDFDIFLLDRHSFGRSYFEMALSLFHQHNLLSHLRVDMMDLRRTLISIERTYHNTNPYHTARHAADVAQAVHCLMMDDKLRPYLTPLEILASVLAALCHDADHPGLNQAYLIKTHHYLATLYQGRSVLENHHYRVGLSILHENPLLQNLSDEDRKYFLFVFRELILSTDISQQAAYLARFSETIENAGGTLDLTEKENRLLVLQMVLKCGDISNPVRVWPIAEQWANLVVEEFYKQGDLEREQQIPVMPMMNKWTTKKAKIQVDFIRYLVLPLFGQWNKFLQSSFSEHLFDLVQSNFRHWQELEEEEEQEDRSPEPTSAFDAELASAISLHPLASELTPLLEKEFITSTNNDLEDNNLGKIDKRIVVGGSWPSLSYYLLTDDKGGGGGKDSNMPVKHLRRLSLPSTMKLGDVVIGIKNVLNRSSSSSSSSSSNNSSSDSGRSHQRSNGRNSTDEEDDCLDMTMNCTHQNSQYFNAFSIPHHPTTTSIVIPSSLPRISMVNNNNSMRRSSAPYGAPPTTTNTHHHHPHHHPTVRSHEQRNSIAIVTSYLATTGISVSRRPSHETTFHFPPPQLCTNQDKRIDDISLNDNWEKKSHLQKQQNYQQQQLQQHKKDYLLSSSTTATTTSAEYPQQTSSSSSHHHHSHHHHHPSDLHELIMAAFGSSPPTMSPSATCGNVNNQRRGSAPVLGLGQLQHQNLLSKYQQNRRCSHSDIGSGMSTGPVLSRRGSCSSFGITH